MDIEPVFPPPTIFFAGRIVNPTGWVSCFDRAQAFQLGEHHSSQDDAAAQHLQG
jgi:hypothetical protein